MTSEDGGRRFPTPPRGQRHLFAVRRFDGPREDMAESFALTRGYWSEDEANRKAAELNDGSAAGGNVYFVLPVRVAEQD